MLTSFKRETHVKKILLSLVLMAALVPMAASADDLSATLTGDGQGIAAIVTGNGQISYSIVTAGIGTPTSAVILQGGSVFVDLGASFSAGSAAGTISTNADLSALESNTAGFSVRVSGPGGTVQGGLQSAGPGVEPPPPPPGDDCPDGYFTDDQYPDFCFRVTITPPGAPPIAGAREEACLEDTVCVSGAVAGRSEAYVRILGPRPNGFLWPTIIRFTPSGVTVDIEQISTGASKTYVLAPVVGGDLTDLSGVQDRTGFQP